MSQIVPPLAAGLVLSFLLEGLMRPPLALPWRRSPGALAIHLGTWGLGYVGLLLLVQRPWFAAAILGCLQLVILQTHQTKWKSLKEPFLYQDFDYFIDAIRHPRLYLPFFGLRLAVVALIAGALAITAFLWLEPSLLATSSSLTALGELLILLLISLVLLVMGMKRLPRVELAPEADLSRMGLFAFLWAYGRHPASPLDERLSPASFREPPCPDNLGELPNVIVVQSESFFDPRGWSEYVRPDLLPTWDRLSAQSLAFGPLTVPAWGANTVRTEAAFLTGLGPEAFGIHRFNPYRQLVRQPMPNLLQTVKRLGYRIVAIHPYPASFYQRDQVLPLLGVEAFIDIDAFAATDRDGQYISDAAVARKVQSVLEDDDSRPVFVFVITMENHGPLQLEPTQSGDNGRLTRAGQAAAPGHDYHDLLVYLRHLENADRMLGSLSYQLDARTRPGLLAWYGDHVPIMADTYRRLGEPAGTTDYLIWSTRHRHQTPTSRTERRVESLGQVVLQHLLKTAEGRPSHPSIAKETTPVSRHHQEQQ